MYIKIARYFLHHTLNKKLVSSIDIHLEHLISVKCGSNEYSGLLIQWKINYLNICSAKHALNIL